MLSGGKLVKKFLWGILSVGCGEDWKSRLLSPHPVRDRQRDTLGSLCIFLQVAWGEQIGCFDGRVRGSGRLGPTASQRLQGPRMGLPPKIQMWASGKTESARNPQILPKRANCTGKETSFERSWKWSTRAYKGNVRDPLDRGVLSLVVGSREGSP